MHPSSIHPYIRIFVIVHISTYLVIMAGKKGGENTKKVAGNAKVRIKSATQALQAPRTNPSTPRQKAEAAAQKQAAADTQAAATESQDWSKGAKGNAKKSAHTLAMTYPHQVQRCP